MKTVRGNPDFVVLLPYDMQRNQPGPFMQFLPGNKLSNLLLPWFVAFVPMVLWSLATTAQVFSGDVSDLQKQAIPGASVRWLGEKKMVYTNQDGVFHLPFPADTTQKSYAIVFSIRSKKDTFEIDDLHSEWSFTMDVNVTLKQVRIKDKRSGAYLSELRVAKTEVINRAEMRKAACCDLAGCFETQSTVQPQTTNILTNAKELRILGLSGVYNQVLVDGLPLIHGLTYTYGINTIPGSMLENIWVVKGSNSVLQGFENMVGQITVFPREGELAEPFTADLHVNSFGEKHLNAGFAFKDSNWNDYLAMHSSQPGARWDRDGDQFLDIPLLTRYSVYNKFRYRKENQSGWSAFLSTRFVDEKRVGGQINYHPDTDAGGTTVYGQSIQYQQPEVFGKAGYRFSTNAKLSLLGSWTLHDQSSWFGVLHYKAKQTYAYANMQYELFWGKTKQHDLKAGLSYRRLQLDETIRFSSDTIPRSFAGNYEQAEWIPGMFAENIFYFFQNKLTLIGGFRADHHNRFGWQFTPRGMLRYKPNEQTDIRLSAGTGWRTVHLFSENNNLLTSGRDILFTEPLQPECSFNTGINITEKMTWDRIELTATADLYHTAFRSQFFPDYDSVMSRVLIYNFKHPSVSNGIQLELMAEAWRRISFRVAYNFLDVWRKQNSVKNYLPFNARHRVLAVFNMHSVKPFWQFDLNVHYYGVQRLPDTKNYPEQFRQPAYSKPFTLVGIQYTQVFTPAFEAFTGCENLFDFRQRRPILSWQNPFSTYFDTSFAYGPTRGREIYIGLRIRKKQKAEKEE